MWTRVCRAAGAAGLLLAGAFNAPVFAKPPDLPVDYHDSYAPDQPRADEALGDKVAATGEEYDSGLGGPGEAPTEAAKPCCPCCAAAAQAVWRILFAALESKPVPAAAAGQPAKPTQQAQNTTAPADTAHDSGENLARVVSARRLYQVGERCLRKGDLDMAYSCFQEVHLLAPTSRYGLNAIDRLSEIESRRAEDSSEAEEQEPPSMPRADEESRGPATVDPARLASAREMYRIGQRCREAGDLDMATSCFQETRLICPHSHYAILAARQLRQIETLRQDDETSEPAETPVIPGIIKPVIGSFLHLFDGSGADKPRIEIIEERCSPFHAGLERNSIRPLTVKPMPLYVDPPARRLTIDQEYPKPSDK
jgi:hypothetical protein